ncbi:winged helix-turn-helix domain-containing protein [Pseudomonas sp. PA-1-3F]|uniref:winged helix-turn-helix domain-containing protein n=1 Tax=Pseudomonas sp. PA-1-3F TaxID=2665465 RepID=UPI001F23FF87|nr:winged helix-turn-helix domain-containing protein [Pseudomonas sp. PA-1-3F]
MQSSIDPTSSDKGIQAEAKKVLILCASEGRQVIFWPSHNTLVIHEHNNQRKVELGYSSSRILEILIDRADTIVSRDEIFAFGWPDRIVGQNSLNQAISTIRELLADDEHREIIQTIPRRGYQFNSEFLVAPGQVSDMSAPVPLTLGVVPSPQVPQGRLSWLRSRLSTESILMGATLILAMSFLWRIDWNLWLQPDFVKETDTQGLLTVWYTGATTPEVERLKVSMAPVLRRMESLLEVPGTVILNTMHSFYEILCISGSTVEFVSVHNSKLALLTDEQLDRCLK